MAIIEIEKITFTDNLKELIKIRSKKFHEADLVTAITNHAKTFMRDQNETLKDVEIPKLKLEIRIKRISKTNVVVGLTKPLHRY